MTSQRLPEQSMLDELGRKPGRGTFEAHVTITAGIVDIERFRSTCAALGVKCIWIELPQGATPSQPMTSSYHRGDLADVIREVAALADAVRQAGFAVTRVKLEAVTTNEGVPASDEEAARFPVGNYFEFHAKVSLPSGADLAPLSALCATHRAHLSSNAFKSDDQGCERFVTLRVYAAGRVNSERAFDALLADLDDAGYAVTNRLREYTIFDSNNRVDAGWLDTPTGDRAANEFGKQLAALEAASPHPKAIRYQYLLHGVLRRWALSARAAEFVLRGGVLTQSCVTPERRPTRDLDLLGLFPRDLADTQTRIEEILTTPTEPDGITLHLDTLVGEVIWQETDFPGLRFRLDTEVFEKDLPLQIDVGFGDPLVPPARWTIFRCQVGPYIRILEAPPELLVAWKLDGLLDHGAKRWQAKDLYDLHLLTYHYALDRPTLTEAIRVAFETHGNSLDDLLTVLYDPAWWQSAPSRAKWEKFRQAARCDIPADLPGFAAEVAARLRPALEPILTFL